MMSFEDYINLNYNDKLDDITKFLISDAYKAGAASRQADIDELKATIVKYEAGLRKNKANKHKLLGEKIELQKRIDEALTFSATWHKSTGSALALEIIKILKGTTQ